MPVNYVGRAGGACLLAALVFCVPDSYAQEPVPGQISPEVFSKQPLELAQLLQAPPDDDDDVTESAAPATATPADTAPTDDEGEFVFAGDLARTLRQIDPDAKVDWDGKKLRIRANGKEFAIFPTGQEMVVDGDVEGGTPPLKIRNGEIYVPQAAISRIGQELERDTLPQDADTTTLLAETPTPTPEASPTPEVTPASSILPDDTPEIATPTPRAGTTPVSVLPDVTPTPRATATPAATAAATAEPAVSQATPFPQATPSPTPAPTPTPTPTPTPAKEDEKSEAERRDATLSTESFKAALQDKVSVSTNDLAVFSMSQLEQMAALRTVEKIIIHADESGLEREDRYGREAAKVSLEIARRMQTHLDDSGIEVVLTRDTEDAVTIGESMETISKSGAQVLIVVSVGYSTAFEDLGGYRVFFMNESVDYSSLNPKTFDASEVVPAELNYKPFQNASKVLASSVKNSISETLDREPVGTNPAPHYLVRRAPMAAATVVVGYLSNPADAKRLTSTEQQDAMARALAEGVKNFATQVSQGKTASGAGGD